MSILGGHGRTNWLIAVLVTLLSALLYYLTAARDIVVGDTPELITAAVTLGVAHPLLPARWEMTIASISTIGRISRAC